MGDRIPEDPEHPWGSLAADTEHGMDVIRRAYDWSIMVDGTVAGLVEGDMGYDATHITIQKDHLEAMCSGPRPEDTARIAELEETTDALRKAKDRLCETADIHAARIAELEAAGNQMRLALAGYVGAQSGIDAWDRIAAVKADNAG